MGRDHSIECPKCGESYGGMSANDESHECAKSPCDSCDLLMSRVCILEQTMETLEESHDLACEQRNQALAWATEAKAEVERLKGDRSVKWYDEWVASQVEVERLRTALAEIGDVVAHDPSWEEAALHAVRVARAALAGPGEAGT